MAGSFLLFFGSQAVSGNSEHWPPYMRVSPMPNQFFQNLITKTFLTLPHKTPYSGTKKGHNFFPLRRICGQQTCLPLLTSIIFSLFQVINLPEVTFTHLLTQLLIKTTNLQLSLLPVRNQEDTFGREEELFL